MLVSATVSMMCRGLSYPLSVANNATMSRLQMVHPKSDEQRQRLSESVKNIFLFQALNEVSLNIVRTPHRTAAMPVVLTTPPSPSPVIETGLRTERREFAPTRGNANEYV